MGVSISRYLHVRRAMMTETTDTSGQIQTTIVERAVSVEVEHNNPQGLNNTRKSQVRIAGTLQTGATDDAAGNNLENLAEQYMIKVAKTKLERRRNRRRKLMIDTDSILDTMRDVPVVEVLFGDDDDDLVDDGYFTQRERQTFERPRPAPVSNTNVPITWRKAERLGQGAFGSVYLGLNVETGELMGVKQIPLSTNRSEATSLVLDNLKQEIRVMASLEHENIVRYLSSETTDEFLNIFLEFVPGGSIASLLQKFGRFNERLVRVYVKQILMGLAYLHSHQIMHRDIKGANILVDTQGVCKLADFGASARLADLSLDGHKSLHGTPYWMAPEVIKQTGHGRQADIWSVGCTIIEMMTGKPPWCNFTTQVSAMFHIATTDELPELPRDLSPEGIDFVKLCLTRDPTHRPNSLKLLTHPFVSSEYVPQSARRRRSKSHNIDRSTAAHINYLPINTPPHAQDSPLPQKRKSHHVIHTSTTTTTPSTNKLRYDNHTAATPSPIGDESLVNTFLDQRITTQLDRVRDADIYKSYQQYNDKFKNKRITRGRNPHDDLPIASIRAIEEKKEISNQMNKTMNEKAIKQAKWEKELQAELQYQRSIANKNGMSKNSRSP